VNGSGRPRALRSINVLPPPPTRAPGSCRR
jgi:hypothetical protein